ncbi:helix-turn-helix domain-containing protein [Streptomyces badius]
MPASDEPRASTTFRRYRHAYPVSRRPHPCCSAPVTRCLPVPYRSSGRPSRIDLPEAPTRRGADFIPPQPCLADCRVNEARPRHSADGLPSRKVAASITEGEDSAEPAPRSRRRRELDLAWDLGQAVYDRRTALGLAQTELARRANMTQPQVSKLELGGSMPTVPLLVRLARAMDADFSLRPDAEDVVRISFVPHTATGEEATPEPPSAEPLSAAEAGEADAGTERTAATG